MLNCTVMYLKNKINFGKILDEGTCYLAYKKLQHYLFVGITPLTYDYFIRLKLYSRYRPVVKIYLYIMSLADARDIVHINLDKD